MRILIVGAGASGIILAIKLKQQNKNLQVVVIDKNNRALKKVMITGNGKCNIGNAHYNNDTYRYFSPLIDKYNITKQIQFFNDLGIETKLIGNLYYPFSESAKAFADYLYEYSLSLGVEYKFNEYLCDYEAKDSLKVISNVQQYTFDKIVFACGGKSYQKFGTDGSIFNILKKHNYDITPLYPGLCPIKTNEKTKDISGMRVKGEVKLQFDGNIKYTENGEVLFKSDGLSGIAIFNISSLIARNVGSFSKARIIVDLFPHLSKQQLLEQLKLKKRVNKEVLRGYFIPKLANYIYERCANKYNASLEELTNVLKGLTFTFKELYDFDSSQVTVGGVSFSNLDHNLQSITEKNVYFIGEIVNNDGLCGGYNLMWAFATALHIGDLLWK